MGTLSPSSANYPWTNPIDADTLQETTMRYDGRGRPTHSTVWLVPLGDIGTCCGGMEQGFETPVPTTPDQGLTTTYGYDENNNLTSLTGAWNRNNEKVLASPH